MGICRSVSPSWLRTFVVAASLAVASFALLYAEDQAVLWTNAVNVSVVNGSLQKTAGCDGCDDAGAVVAAGVDSGRWVRRVHRRGSEHIWAAGFSHGNTDTTYSDIDFAFLFNGGGWAAVFENGIYQNGGDTPYAPGDVFRVAVVGGKIRVQQKRRDAPREPDRAAVSARARRVALDAWRNDRQRADRRARSAAAVWRVSRKIRIADISRTVYARSDPQFPSGERRKGCLQVPGAVRHDRRAFDQRHRLRRHRLSRRTSATRTGETRTTMSAGRRC